MRTLIILLFLFLSKPFFSQSIGWKYDDVLTNVEADNHIERTRLVKDEKFFVLQAFYINSSIIDIMYAFDNGKQECFKIIITYRINSINEVINNTNKNFVKISEFEWKDYGDNRLLKLEKKDSYFTISISRDNK